MGTKFGGKLGIKLSYRGMNRNKFLPILAVAGVLLVIAIVWFLRSDGTGLFGEKWTGVEGEPINIALDFYEDWLEARNAGDNEPFTRELLAYQQIGPDLRERLQGFEGQLAVGQEDPVLCMTELPEGLRTMPVYVEEESAQFLVRGLDRTQVGQAVVTMAAKNGLWQITEISCGGSETAPEGEFSFDRSGFLLKQVPAPLNSEYWHLVYEEDGVLGHAVPLYIDAESVCVQKDGAEVTCDDSVLKETTPARVLGQLSETGVTVKRIELIESVSVSD